MTEAEKEQKRVKVNELVNEIRQLKADLFKAQRLERFEECTILKLSITKNQTQLIRLLQY